MDIETLLKSITLQAYIAGQENIALVALYNSQGYAQAHKQIEKALLEALPEKRATKQTSGVFNSDSVELGMAGYNQAIDDTRAALTKLLRRNE